MHIHVKQKSGFFFYKLAIRNKLKIKSIPQSTTKRLKLLALKNIQNTFFYGRERKMKMMKISLSIY